MGTEACVSQSSVKYLQAFVGISMEDSRKGAVQGIVRQLTLFGEHEGLVKRFDAFDKARHTVPKFASDRAQLFLARLAESELAEWGEERFGAYREAMNYRRKDIAVVVEAGRARIESKDFTIERRYLLNEDSPDRYRVETELLEASSLGLLEDEPFNEATGPVFERLRCHFKREVSVESLIDGIEDSEEQELSVDYPSTCEHCEAKFEGLNAVFRFDSASLEIRFPSFGVPKQLIDAFRSMEEKLAAVPAVNDWFRID